MKKKGLSMNLIMALTLTAVAVSVLLCVNLVFMQTYRRTLLRNAETTSRQAIAQAGSTMNEYLENMDDAVTLLTGYLELPAEEREARFEAFLEIRADVVAVTTYDAEGEMRNCYSLGRRLREDIQRILKMHQEDRAAEVPLKDEPEKTRPAVPRRTKSEQGIMVEGLSNCLVKFAKCCTPVPGDDIVGFITRGYGVSVHRADCPNAAPEKRKPEEADRWVKVSWVDSKLPNYKTALELSSKDRDGLTLDVAMALSTAKVKVNALSARSMPDGHAIVNMVLEVKDKDELAAVINKLNNIQGVYHVARASGK